MSANEITRAADVGRVPPHGGREFTRIKRAWRWQDVATLL